MNRTVFRWIFARYPKPVPILMGVSSLVAAYSLFYIGFFSRTPFSHIIIMGAWSTSGVSIEVSTKIVVSALSGRLFFYAIYEIVRNTNLAYFFIKMFLQDHRTSRALQLRITRFFRRNSFAGSLLLGLSFFALFAFSNFFGLHAIVKVTVALMVTPTILYPLFFRPEKNSFPRHFTPLPKRPLGISEDRWFLYALSCFSIVAASFFYFTGQSFFQTRAAKLQTLYTESNSVVGSTIAANGSGVLFLVHKFGTDDWRYNERDYVFFPFEAITKISDKLPDSYVSKSF